MLQANARYLDALAAVDDPTPGKQALQRLTTAKKDAAGRACPGFNPLAQFDAMLFKSPMAGERCLHGFTNRDVRARLAKTPLLRSCGTDPKKASAKVGRCFRRLHAHGLIAKIPRTRRWRVTDYGRKVMATTMYLREHHFPNVYAAVVHWTSSQETRNSRRKNLCPTGAEPLLYMTGGAASKLAPITELRFDIVESLIFDGLLAIQAHRLAL